MSREKLEKLLGELKSEYLVSLPAKLQKIKDLTEQNNWEELGGEYHKLKGTGKTYGYPEITLICKQLELMSECVEFQKTEVFQKAHTLLCELYENYKQEKQIDLENNPLAREILSYKLEPK